MMKFYFAIVLILVAVIGIHSFLRSMFGLDGVEFAANYDKEEIKQVIVREAENRGVSVNLALFLAAVESNFNPRAKNPSSSATGLFQFLDGTWAGNCDGNRLDPEDNSRCAMKLLGEGGIHHWTADSRTAKRLRQAGFVR